MTIVKYYTALTCQLDNSRISILFQPSFEKQSSSHYRILFSEIYGVLSLLTDGNY